MIRRTYQTVMDWNKRIQIPELSHCHIFLAGKLLNDVFYEGLYNGLSCVVKCSSVTPSSIQREYGFLVKLYGLSPNLFPRPLKCVRDGQCAFIVMEKVKGVTLWNFLKSPREPEMLEHVANQLMKVAMILFDCGIVHRDVRFDNFICDQNGNLKMIDFQLAISSSAQKDDIWLDRHPRYKYIVMGTNPESGLGIWDDIPSFLKILAAFPASEQIDLVRNNLIGLQGKNRYVSNPPRYIYYILWAKLLLLYGSFFVHTAQNQEILLERMRRYRKLIHGERTKSNEPRR